MARAQGKAFVDDDGGEVGIEHDRAERILDAADEHRLIDESIERPAQPAPLRARLGQRSVGAPVTIRVSK